MPARNYAESGKSHTKPKWTPDHITAGFISLAKPLIDWKEVTVSSVQSFPGLLHYEFSKPYCERLYRLGQVIGNDFDLTRPLTFLCKKNITKDLGIILLKRYFDFIGKGGDGRSRYLYSFDCKSLTFIQDVYNKNRSPDKNPIGPADIEYTTEQDLLSEVFLWFGTCSNTGFTWSAPFESFMEGREAVVPLFVGNKDYRMVTWGLLIGGRSDIANNTSEKGMQRLMMYLEGKKESDRWQIIDLNGVKGYSEYIEKAYDVEKGSDLEKEKPAHAVTTQSSSTGAANNKEKTMDSIY